MKKETEIELKVGFFVTVGLGLIMLSILMLGGADSIFTRQNEYTALFPSAEGLISGSRVTLGGMSVGTVTEVDFDEKTSKVVAKFMIARKYTQWLRGDSYAEIATQGLLGDKYIAINSGTPESPVLPPGSVVNSRTAQGLTDILSKSDQLMVSLNSIAGNLDVILKNFREGGKSEIFFDGMSKTAKNLASLSSKLNQELDQMPLKTATRNLNGILEKVNNGTGTLGALVNDPSLYYDVRALMGGANRNRIIRNLVRQTIKENEEAGAEEQAPKKK